MSLPASLKFLSNNYKSLQDHRPKTPAPANFQQNRADDKPIFSPGPSSSKFAPTPGVCLVPENPVRRRKTFNCVHVENGVERVLTTTRDPVLCLVGEAKSVVRHGRWTPIHVADITTEDSFTTLANDLLRCEMWLIAHEPTTVRIFGHDNVNLALPKQVSFSWRDPSDKEGSVRGIYNEGVVDFSDDPDFATIRLPARLEMFVYMKNEFA